MHPHTKTGRAGKTCMYLQSTQMNLILGDPPGGVWALYLDVSCQGSRVNVAFDLTG
jgi:hypothetical protein